MQFPPFHAIIYAVCCSLSLPAAAELPITPATPPTADRAALATRLLATEGVGTAEELLAEPAYRTGLLAHEVLRLTGEPALRGLAAANPMFDRFLARFLADPEWLRAYLASGRPIANTAAGLEVLFFLWQAEGNSADFGTYRNLSAALANQWSVGPNAGNLLIKRDHPDFPARPLDRFRLYRNLDRAGRLHPMFRKLKSWELGYVVGQQWSDADLAWLNEHANLPLERYPDACWAVEYKGTSDFGDTVQGPLYLWPGNIHFIDLAKVVFGDDAGLETALLQLARAHLFQDAGRAAAADEALAAFKTGGREIASDANTSESRKLRLTVPATAKGRAIELWAESCGTGWFAGRGEIVVSKVP